MAAPAIPPPTVSGQEGIPIPWYARDILQRALLVLIIAAAALLRFHAISSKTFWVDEGASAEIARLPWRQFFLLVWHREANMALYHALLHFWIRISATEGFVRGLSAVFSVATVPIVYATGKRLFGAATGLVAGWLLTIHAFHVRYAQETRSYALTVFLVTLASWLFVRHIQEPGRTSWSWYVGVSALAVYSHFLAALSVVAHGLSLGWLKREDVPWRDYARSLRWFGYAVLPLAVFALHVGGTWNWLQRPSLATLLYTLMVMTGNGGPALAILTILILAWTSFLAWRDWQLDKKRMQGWGYAFVFSWLLIPPLLAFVISFAKPLFLARYLIPSLPALALGIAAGLVRIRPAALAWTVGIVLSLLCIRGTLAYYQQDFDIYREDWRSATKYILDHARPGDSIFFTNYGRPPYEYYRSLSNAAGPAVISGSPGDLEYLDFFALPLAEIIRDARPATDRVWLVFFLYRSPSGQPDESSRMVRSHYGKGRRLIDQQEFRQMTVMLFEGHEQN